MYEQPQFFKQDSSGQLGKSQWLISVSLDASGFRTNCLNACQWLKEKISLFLFLFAYSITSAQLRVEGLLTEDIYNPINLDMPQPRFSWRLISDNRNIIQSAYEINITSGKSTVWQSGKINSDQSLYIVYAGSLLESRKEYNWTVRVWDNHGNVSAWSRPAFFQMAFLSTSDWQARWIGYDGTFSPDEKPGDHFTRVYARYLRKDFSADDKIKKAVAYISGVGLYELYLNGNKVGNDVLAPGPTDYAKRVFYNTFDVTKQIRQGNNAIGVILGNGRFVPLRQHLEDTTNNCVNYGFPKLLVQLEITYGNGKTKIVTSDASWKISGDGPLSANSEFDGEEYNATKEFNGWAQAGFTTDSRWKNAQPVTPAAPIIQSQLNRPIRIMQTIKPVAVTNPKPGMYIFNTAQNMVGWAQLKVKGAKGTTIRLRFAERLNDDGTIYTENLGDARVTDI